MKMWRFKEGWMDTCYRRGLKPFFFIQSDKMKRNTEVYRSSSVAGVRRQRCSAPLMGSLKYKFKSISKWLYINKNKNRNNLLRHNDTYRKGMEKKVVNRIVFKKINRSASAEKGGNRHFHAPNGALLEVKPLYKSAQV